MDPRAKEHEGVQNVLADGSVEQNDNRQYSTEQSLVSVPELPQRRHAIRAAAAAEAGGTPALRPDVRLQRRFFVPAGEAVCHGQIRPVRSPWRAPPRLGWMKMKLAVKFRRAARGAGHFDVDGGNWL